MSLRTTNGYEAYYIIDGLGSPVQFINQSTVQSAVYSYDPYGAQTDQASGTAAIQNPYRYVGGTYDRTTGYIKYGQRWYDPTTGRFTTQTPSPSSPTPPTETATPTPATIYQQHRLHRDVRLRQRSQYSQFVYHSGRRGRGHWGLHHLVRQVRELRGVGEPGQGQQPEHDVAVYVDSSS
ncbi:hypothetical protein OG285_37730 (plasmid) [Streptomyces sp. NBC_01471]